MNETSSTATSQPAPAPPGQTVRVDLSRFANPEFDRGAGMLKEALWLVIRQVLFLGCPFSFSALKCGVLRAFGAKIGKGVTIKPGVKITFPWKLEVGDHVWLGEDCWLLNLDRIVIHSHVCVSQRAFLCTGSHDYRKSTFNLITLPITLDEGVWIGASAWVGPGVTARSHALLTAGSVTGKNLPAWGIYQGNPAVKVRERRMRE